MKLTQFRNVLLIAKRGSLRSAARELGITQPALTRSIRDLEHELGTVIFERHGSGMVLTEIGLAVLNRATGIQREIERLSDEVAQLKGERTGTVTIGLSSISQLALLPHVAASFYRKYPDIQLNILEGVYRTLDGQIQNGAIDFYVGPMQVETASLSTIVEPLFENTRLIFCRRGHALASAGSLVELIGAKWITGPATRISEEEFSPLFARYNLPAPWVAATGQSFLSMIAMAASSDLLTLIPQQWLEVLKATGFIQHINVKERLPISTICIVKRSSLPLTPVAEHLSDLFRRAAIRHARSLPGNPVLTA